jgi:hypothetical protein
MMSLPMTLSFGITCDTCVKVYNPTRTEWIFTEFCMDVILLQVNPYFLLPTISNMNVMDSELARLGMSNAM